MNKNNLKNKIILKSPEKIMTLANIISLMRAGSAIPIVYTLNYPEWQWLTAVIILLAVLSDALDGYYARKADQVTQIGMWLDPIADFAVIISVVLYLVIMDLFPLWFFLFYLIRHFTIAIPALYYANSGQYILSANWWGKWATGISTLTIFLHIFEFETLWWLKTVALYTATFLSVISWIIYFNNYLKVYRGIDVK